MSLREGSCTVKNKKKWLHRIRRRSGRKTYANKSFRFNTNEHTNWLRRGDGVALNLWGIT